MTKKQLLALRTVVVCAEHHIRQQRPSQQRLEWTRELRTAWQAVREVTHRFLDETHAQGKKWEEL